MNKKQIVKTYKSYSPFYDKLFGAIFEKGRYDAIKLLNLKGNEKVLEVGVGSGLSLKRYPESTKIVGIDLSGEMLKKAEEKVLLNKLKGIDLKLEDAEEMVFGKDSFDKVIIMYTLSVTPNPDKLLEKAHKVCKNNGDILILNHFNHKKSIFYFLYGRILRYIERKLGFRMYFPIKKYLSYIKELGAKDIKVISTNFGFSKIIHLKKQV
ncbi:class I SAM-dependent methyltransferase [Candidatus Margulisiibacteriota bacterium]